MRLLFWPLRPLSSSLVLLWLASQSTTATTSRTTIPTTPALRLPRVPPRRYLGAHDAYMKNLHDSDTTLTAISIPTAT